MIEDVDLAWPLRFRFAHSRKTRLLTTLKDAVSLVGALTEAERRSLHWAATAGAVSRALGIRRANTAEIATEMIENALAVEGWLILDPEAPDLAALHA